MLHTYFKYFVTIYVSVITIVLFLPLDGTL